eukprot:scaffold51080_cov45-Attheya_sp.AAC.1
MLEESIDSCTTDSCNDRDLVFGVTSQCYYFAVYRTMPSMRSQRQPRQRYCCNNAYGNRRWIVLTLLVIISSCLPVTSAFSTGRRPLTNDIISLHNNRRTLTTHNDCRATAALLSTTPRVELITRKEKRGLVICRMNEDGTPSSSTPESKGGRPKTSKRSIIMSTIMSSIGREGGDSEESDKMNVEQESSKLKGVFSRFRSNESEEMKQPKKKEEGNVFSVMWDSVFNKDDNSGENWVVVCPKTRISPGEVVPVVASGLDLLIVASMDGKRVSCLANSCPHLGMPLETGRLERRPMEGISDGVPSEDGMEDCIVCPLHETAFALETGEVRGEWCPHPPIIGKMMGAVKPKTNAATFQIRVRGKNIEVRINSSLDDQNAATRKRR